MTQWFMLTVVGQDQPGIVAKITTALYEANCLLGEASMMLLGGNFTIMLMVKSEQDAKTLMALLQPVAESLNLRIHLDAIEGQLHHHHLPDVAVHVHSADRAGIVAQVTNTLAEAGLNVIDLDSDVGGDEDNPFYVMHIEGQATQGIAALETALQQLLTTQPDLEVHITPIETAIM